MTVSPHHSIPSHKLTLQEPQQSQTLLLIFRKESPDLFHLLNETGLPISATSPLLISQTQGKTLVVAPLLLVAVTEAMRGNQDVFGGLYVPLPPWIWIALRSTFYNSIWFVEYVLICVGDDGSEYLMSWTANDFRHFYVILEKRPPPKTKSDDNHDSSSSPWGDKPDDQKSNSGGWGDNNNNDTNNNNSNDQNGNSGSAWGDNSTSNDNNNSGSNDAWGVPPSSPVKDSSSSNNAGSEFKNHEWPAGMVNANTPNGNGNGNGGGRGRAASGGSEWDVRDWARSPSEVGGAGAGAGGGGGGGWGGTPATTATGSSKGKSGGW